MDEMTMRRAIERKREGEALSNADWEAIIAGYMAGRVDDAQMSALAMACVWRGLSMDEIAALTGAMAESGESISHGDGELVVDKHSSGGVSDIVSLVAVPLVAARGVRVAKLSGRALGHTGGTVDKLETIPGFDVAPSTDRFVEQVKTVGAAIAAQTEAIVPADKRLYRLRDRTATIPSVGLIAASIVSKKLAGGAHAFVFDVKCGSASFMKNEADATELARTLVEISHRFGRRARAVVSDMNEPLGHSIGTALEVIEARDVLLGHGHDRRKIDAIVHVAANMLELADVKNPQEAAVAALHDRSGYKVFVAMVEAQGGSREALESMRPHHRAHEVRAKRSGFVTQIDGVALGNAARELSAGEPSAGIRVRVRVGDRVESGAPLAHVYGSRAEDVYIGEAFTISDEPPPARPLIYATI